MKVTTTNHKIHLRYFIHSRISLSAIGHLLLLAAAVLTA